MMLCNRLILGFVLCFLSSSAWAQAVEETPYIIGLRYLQAGDTVSAVEIWNNSAYQGDAFSAYGLAKLYEWGADGIEQDFEKAMIWYERSAKAGNAAALNNLGVMHQQGRGVPSDLLKAFEYFRGAAEDGYLQGQYNYGLAYFQGKGTSRNLDRAFKWFSLAAEQGLPAAQFALAELYRLGLGHVQDLEAARAWYARAAASGHPHAQRRLASMDAVAVPDIQGRMLEPTSEIETVAPGPKTKPTTSNNSELAPDSTSSVPPMRPVIEGAAEAAADPTVVKHLTVLKANEVVPDAVSAFSLWLGTAESETKALSFWQELLSIHGDDLASRPMELRKVVQNSGAERYRIMIGGIDTAKQGSKLCQVLRTKDRFLFCMPLENLILQ